jgi:hypothetical protein
LFEKREVGEIFGPPDEFLAGDDPRQRKHPDLATIPLQHFGPIILGGERIQSIDAIKKIHQRVVIEGHDGAGEDFGAKFLAISRARTYWRSGNSSQISVSKVVAGTPWRMAAVIPAN